MTGTEIKIAIICRFTGKKVKKLKTSFPKLGDFFRP